MNKLKLAGLCVALTTTLARGDVVSNFANPKNSTCKPFIVSDSTFFADSFTTGSSVGGYWIGEVFLSIVSVTLDPAATAPGGTFRVQLWQSDAAGNPDSVIDNLAGAGKTVSQGDELKPGVLSYSAHQDMLLNPNTKYWILMHVYGGNDLTVGIERTENKAEISNPPAWTIGDDAFILEEGAPRFDSSCVPFLKITSPGVPEPSSLALLGLAGAGLLTIARRQA